MKAFSRVVEECAAMARCEMARRIYKGGLSGEKYDPSIVEVKTIAIEAVSKYLWSNQRVSVSRLAVESEVIRALNKQLEKFDRKYSAMQRNRDIDEARRNKREYL